VQSLLQACASTLTEVTLDFVESIPWLEPAPEVAAVLASCPHLERLKAPLNTLAVLAPCPRATFRRLVHLGLYFCFRDGRALSSVALWGLMAKGGLPNLTSLHMNSTDWKWGAVMVAAFEGVAGTLKALKLKPDRFEHDEAGVKEDGMLRQLGEAIGKLRRLENLRLYICNRGVEYHRIAQGMPEGACPALRSLTLGIKRGAAWLACQPSIIRPSVQKLRVKFLADEDGAEPLAVACALKIVGYRGYVTMNYILAAQEQEEEEGEEGGTEELRAEIRRLLTPLPSGLAFGSRGPRLARLLPARRPCVITRQQRGAVTVAGFQEGG
jgi:hypothetical protein